MAPMVNDILSFIAFLAQSNLSHSTINCYLSGISFFCKINYLEDVTQIFIVRKCLEGIKKSRGHSKDRGLPITSVLVGRIIDIPST